MLRVWPKALSTALLFSFVTLATAWAAHYDVYETVIADPSKLRQFVRSFRPNDTVTYHPIGGQIRTFQLGESLGEGDNGRVFELSNSNPPEVVKFQNGAGRSRQAMAEEIQAQRQMEADQLVHAKLGAHDPSFFLIKSRVQGENYRKIERHWLRYSKEDRIEILRSALKMVSEIRASKTDYDDLENIENIMFDRKTRQAVLIDPGAVGSSGNLGKVRLLEERLKKSQIFGPIFLVLDEPQWLDKVLSLQEIIYEPVSSRDAQTTTKQLQRIQILLPQNGPTPPTFVQDMLVDFIERIPRKSLVDPSVAKQVDGILMHALKDPKLTLLNRKRAVDILTDYARTPDEIMGVIQSSLNPFEKQNPPNFDFDEVPLRKFLDSAPNDAELQHFLASLPKDDLKESMLAKLAKNTTSPESYLHVLSLPLGKTETGDRGKIILGAMNRSKLTILQMSDPSAAAIKVREKLPTPTTSDSQADFVDVYSSLSGIAVSRATSLEEAMSVFHDRKIGANPYLRNAMTEIIDQNRAHLASLGLSPEREIKYVQQLGMEHSLVVCLMKSLTSFGKKGPTR